MRNTNQTLADNIQTARQAKKWTQHDLAKHAGVSISTIIRAEKGRVPYSENLDAIANALDTTVAKLYGHEPEDFKSKRVGDFTEAELVRAIEKVIGKRGGDGREQLEKLLPGITNASENDLFVIRCLLDGDEDFKENMYEYAEDYQMIKQRNGSLKQETTHDLNKIRKRR